MTRKVYPRIPVTCVSCSSIRMLDPYYARRANGKCRKCSSLIGSKAKKPSRVTGKDVNCLACDNTFWQYRHLEGVRKFCSKDCADNHKRVYKKEVRHCKQCSNEFVYSDKPNSNTAGNFCSLKCRDESYLKPDKFSRSGWNTARNKFLKAGNNFCFKCHTNENLEVHHLVPHHLTKDNSDKNLVTLCESCHKIADRITLKSWKKSEVFGGLVSSLIGAKLEDSWHLYKGNNLNVVAPRS